jgi:glycine cleavage system H lipoate-binding protein/ABC-type phosphate transport system substrate-binding protein
MKPIILLFFTFILLTSNSISSKDLPVRNILSEQDSLTILCSPGLYSLTTNWADEYCRLNPAIKIKVNISQAGFSTEIKNKMELGFMSHEDFTSYENKALWKMVVGRDIIVPIVNLNNPFFNALQQQGISSDELALIFTDPSRLSWGTLAGTGENIPVKFYLMNNEYVKSAVAKFLSTEKARINGIIVENSSEMVSRVQKDPLGIGFCKLTDILDPKNQQIVENIRILPIDRNGNGKLDYSEQIYDKLDVFTRGVWIGKYPKELYGNIYSVSATQPSSELEVAFLKWVLTDGQQFISPNGYSDLTSNERQSKVDDLNLSKIDLVASNNEKSIPKMILLILAITVVISFILEALIKYRKRRISVQPVAASIFQPVFNENSVTMLNGLLFDKTHTWTFMEKDGLVRMGIDDFLQHVTGRISRINMKNPGDKINKGEPVLTIIQNGKQLTVFAPVSGIIMEQNQNLKTDATLLNSSPYSEGWIYMIEPSNWIREIQFLFMAERYQAWLKIEFARLKDFLAVFVKRGTAEYAPVILQDGGELKDNLLSGLAPEVWEDFQTHFLDNSK